MGVQMDGQLETLAQCRDQRVCRRRPEQPGHVLDREYVSSGRDDPICQPEVVVECVERRVRVGQVSGVAK